MAHLPFAFSIHHFINSVGSDAGFASIIGLAILVLLYFAQARETSTLRSRADDAEQRAGQLEARLAQVTRAQAGQAGQAGQGGQGGPVAPATGQPTTARPLVNPAPPGQRAPDAPVAAQAGPAVAVAPGALAAVPAAPAGVGAPALASATRLIPGPAIPQPVAAAGPGVTSTAVEPVGAGAPPVAAAAASGLPSAVATAPPPSTVAGGLGRGSNGEHASNGVAEAAPFEVEDHDPIDGSDPGSEPFPRVELRSGGAQPQRRPAPPGLLRTSGPEPRRGIGRALPLVVAAIVAVAVIAVLVVVISGGGKSATPTPARTTNAPVARTHHRSALAAFNASSVSVGVLNGTPSAGLAAKVMQQLSSAGYKQGIKPANAASQTEQSTVVAYEPGHRSDAVHVASALKLSSSAVQPIDNGTQNVACPQSTSCTVDVVVTVGQDLAGG